MDLAELVGKVQSGDQEAFEVICKRFEGLVRKYARQPHLWSISEEAEAEAWLAVVQAVMTFRKSVGAPVAGYVESKVKFALWNLFKRQRRYWQHEMPGYAGTEQEGMTLEQVSDTVDVAGEAEFRCLLEDLRQAADTLPVRQRQVVWLTILGDCSLTEAAREMGITVQAVHNLRQRALLRLKQGQVGMYRDERR